MSSMARLTQGGSGPSEKVHFLPCNFSSFFFLSAPPAAPPRPVRNTASWSGTAYSFKQAWLISQLTLISVGRSPIHHRGTRRVGDGRPTAETEAVWPRCIPLICPFPSLLFRLTLVFVSTVFLPNRSIHLYFIQIPFNQIHQPKSEYDCLYGGFNNHILKNPTNTVTHLEF